MAQPRDPIGELFAAWRLQATPPSAARSAAATPEHIAGVASALREVARRRRRRQRLRRIVATAAVAASVSAVALGGWFGYREPAVVADAGQVNGGQLSLRGATGDVSVVDAEGRLMDVAEAVAGAELRLAEGFRLRTESGSASQIGRAHV